MGQSMLFALIFTMGVALLAIQRNDRVARLVAGRRPTAEGRREEESVAAAARDLDQHVILCGCGRIGRLVAVVLEAARLPYIAIEADVGRFRAAKRLGHHVVFGDASRAGILARAGSRNARVIVVTFSEVRAIERLLHHARSRQPELLALISVDDDREVAKIAAAGATVVFAENLAAGLELGAETLHLHGLSRDDAAGIVAEARATLAAALQRDGSELSVWPVHDAERRRARQYN
jgi:CPA2 family monovalent cation:H+ antiporter-2